VTEHVAYVGIGSNIEPGPNILAAVAKLARAVSVTAVSGFYRNPAIGRPADPPFVNGVARILTGMPPRALVRDVLRSIESALGRRRGPDRYAPRTIDLDLLLYGSLVVEEGGLRLPDPDIRTRPFLAVALGEIDSSLTLPDTGEPVASFADTTGLEPVPHLADRIRGTLAHE
jgi:2-amino-4-hydroxy-6-hydroxymethyldihydropteridine diphosphokinase